MKEYSLTNIIVWSLIAAFVCSVLGFCAYMMARHEFCLASGCAAFLALLAWAVKTS